MYRARLLSAVLVCCLCGIASAVDLDLITIGGRPPDILPYSASDLPTPEFMSASNLLSGVPVAMWWYGCSATSAGMMMGYYDANGYSNMYNGTIVGQMDGAELDLIANAEHIADYWVAYGSGAADPWTSGGSDHAWDQCTADFMGTNQLKWDYSPFPAGDDVNDTNTDGSTTFLFWSDGSPTYDLNPDSELGTTFGSPDIEGCSGLRMFVESRGYNVAFAGGEWQNFSQYIDTQGLDYGFSYADYKAEIDAGRPVLIHVEDHTMLGWGYNDDDDQVIFYDTWDTDPHSMGWGGSHGGLAHYGVTVLRLDPSGEGAIPEPGTFGLFGLGAVAAGLWIRRRRAA